MAGEFLNGVRAVAGRAGELRSGDNRGLRENGPARTISSRSVLVAAMMRDINLDWSLFTQRLNFALLQKPQKPWAEHRSADRQFHQETVCRRRPARITPFESLTAPVNAPRR